MAIINRNTRFRLLVLLMGLQMGVGGCTKKANQAAPPPAPEDPIAALQKAIVKAPSYENHIALGLRLAEANRSQEALDMYKRATEINPDGPLAWNNICAEHNKQGRFAEAVPNCEKAVALDSAYVLARNNLKLAKDSLAEQKKAAAVKKAAILANATATAQDFVNVGMDLYNVKDFESSVTIWNRVKPGDALYATAQNNIASSYILLGKFKPAEKALNEALKLEPENKLFSNNKKWLEEARSAKQ